MSIIYKNHVTYPKHIYVRDFLGKVDIPEIIRSWEFLLNNNLITPDTKGIINNLSECQLDMNLNSFQSLMEYLKSRNQFNKLKLAVICNDPRTIVFPTLGELQEKSLKIKPFTSEIAAVEWIMGL